MLITIDTYFQVQDILRTLKTNPAGSIQLIQQLTEDLATYESAKSAVTANPGTVPDQKRA